MAVLQSADERHTEAAVAGVRTDTVAWLTRTFIIAAALTVGAELLLQRLAPPILAQVTSPGSAFATALVSVGDLAADGGAVLVFLAVAAFVAQRRSPALALAAATATVVLATFWTVQPALLGVHISVVAAAAAMGLGVLRRGRSLFSFGVALAAFSVVAGQLPFLVDGTRGSLPNVVAVRPLAELLVVAAAVMLGASLIANRAPSVWTWLAAGASAVVIAGALTFQPGFSAIGAIWAVGATLALPPILYVAGAAAAGLLVAGWSSSPATRPLAAAVVLMLAAGIQPQVLHHDLTALLAIAVLYQATANTGEEI